MPDPNISVPAALIGEPTRAAILMTLCDGRAHAAGALAGALNISPQSASNHLALLVDGGLLTVVQQGRHRYYRIASSRVAQSIEALAVIAAPLRPELLQRSRAHERTCTARRCYSHLAGQLGVQLLDALLGKHYLIAADRTATGRTIYLMTEAGVAWARQYGLSLPDGTGEANPQFAVSCVDWTERRDHLAGTLATQLLRRWLDEGIVVPGSVPRSLEVTRAGTSYCLAEFGLEPRSEALRSA